MWQRKQKSEKPKKPGPSLGTVQLNDDLMKVDFQLTDKFQGFSAELVRIPLLGIAVFGFLVKEVFLGTESSLWVVIFSVLAVVFFALSAAAALLHRYLSTDSIACHIRYLRIITRMKAPETAVDKPEDSKTSHTQPALVVGEMAWLEEEKEKERKEWHQALKNSGECLKWSALSLGLAAGSLAIAFAILLLSKHVESLYLKLIS